MSFLNCGNLPISTELKELLVDFVLNCLQKRPDNLYTHAAAFFQEKLGIQRNQSDMLTEKVDLNSNLRVRSASSNDNLEENELKTLLRIDLRREAIRSDSWNPDKFEDGGFINFELPNIDIGSTGSLIEEVIVKTEIQREILHRLINRISIFRCLDDAEMDRVIEMMQRIEVSENDVIINEGEDGAFFYIIQSGNFEVFNKDTTGVLVYQSTMQNQGSFGELSLLYNQPRTETVVAISSGVLWTIDRRTFKQIVVQKAHSRRIKYVEFLSKVPLLQSLTTDEKTTISDMMHISHYDKNDWIFEKGSVNEHLYIVDTGSVGIFCEKDGKKVLFDTIETGGYFGEVSLMTNNPVDMFARAIEKSDIAMLNRETFERILGPCLEILSRNREEYYLKLKEYFGKDYEA